MQKVFFIFPFYFKSCLFINPKFKDILDITTRMVITIFIVNKAWVRCGYPKQNEREWYKGKQVEAIVFELGKFYL